MLLPLRMPGVVSHLARMENLIYVIEEALGMAQLVSDRLSSAPSQYKSRWQTGGSVASRLLTCQIEAYVRH